MKKWNVAHTILMLAALVFALTVMTACDEEPPKPKAECAEDQDCPSGKACQGGKCITKVSAPPPPECVTADDCGDNKVCLSGKCKYECLSNSSCGSDEACEEHRCVSKPQCEIETINFDFNQHYLTSEAQSTLRNNASCLKDKKVGKVIIEGHCDERGGVQYNLSLGQKRAQSVRDFLVDLGIEKSAVKVISYGEEKPVSYGHDEDSWARNRRGETVTND